MLDHTAAQDRLARAQREDHANRSDYEIRRAFDVLARDLARLEAADVTLGDHIVAAQRALAREHNVPPVRRRR